MNTTETSPQSVDNSSPEEAGIYSTQNELRLLVTEIVNRWKLIAFSGVLVATIAALAWTPLRNEVRVDWRIIPVSENEIAKFDQINRIADELDTRERDNEDYRRVRVTRKFLVGRFLEKLREREQIMALAKQNDLIPRSEFDSDRDHNAAIQEFAYDIEITGPETETADFRINPNTAWISVFDSVGETNSRVFVGDLVRLLTVEIRDDMLAEYKIIADTLQKEIAYLREDLTTNYANLIEDHDRTVVAKLARIEQDIAIAKSLDIRENTLDLRVFDNSTNVVPLANRARQAEEDDVEGAELAAIVNQPPGYLKGYVALEQELELTKAQKGDERFVEGLDEVIQKIRSLDQDRRIERLQTALNESPLNNGDFSTIVYHAGSVAVDNRFSLSLMIFGGLIAGLFLGVSFVVVRYWIRD